MTVDTEQPVREAPSAQQLDESAELVRTMAAMVRTIFGVALQAPADEAPAPSGQPAQVEAVPAAPVAVALPVDVPAQVPVEAPMAAPVEQPTLVAVPDVPEPVQVEAEAPTSIAMPSLGLAAEGSWSPPQSPSIVIPAYSPPEPPAPVAAPSLPMPDSYSAGIPVPTYVAPVVPPAPVADRHSMALLHEIAFLDD